MRDKKNKKKTLFVNNDIEITVISTNEGNLMNTSFMIHYSTKQLSVSCMVNDLNIFFFLFPVQDML